MCQCLHVCQLKALGDNDPVDVVEIGSKALAMGSVTTVGRAHMRQSTRTEAHESVCVPVLVTCDS